MHRFKTASRSADEMTIAKAKIVEAFDLVKGPNGSVNKSGIKELKAMEMELGELIIQLMNDTVALTDPTPFLVDDATGTYGNDYVWQEVSAALRVVDRAIGSKPRSQRLDFSEFSISTGQKEIVMEVPLEQIASGRYNPGMIAEVMADALNRYRISFILDSIDTAVTAVQDHTGRAGYNLRYTGLTDVNLDRAVDGLHDEGGPPVVYGRHIALVPIRAFTGWSSIGSDAALEEFRLRGMIGNYNGAQVVSLNDQWSRRSAAHLIRSDRLYLANGMKGAMYMRKDVSFLDFAEVLPAEGLYRVGTRIEDGIKVWNPHAYRVVTVP